MFQVQTIWLNVRDHKSTESIFFIFVLVLEIRHRPQFVVCLNLKEKNKSTAGSLNTYTIWSRFE